MPVLDGYLMERRAGAFQVGQRRLQGRLRGEQQAESERQPDAGVLRVGDTVQLAYADQSRTLDRDKTVYEVISEGLDDVQLGKVKMNARAYCSRFNFGGADQQKKVSQLSGGERNRVHLARMLKEGANVLLLGRLLRRQLQRVRGVAEADAGRCGDPAA